MSKDPNSRVSGEEINPYESPKNLPIEGIPTTFLREKFYYLLKHNRTGEAMEKEEYPKMIQDWIRSMENTYYSSFQTSKFGLGNVYKEGSDSKTGGTWYRVEFSLFYKNEVQSGSHPHTHELLIDPTGEKILFARHYNKAVGGLGRTLDEELEYEDYPDASSLETRIIESIRSSLLDDYNAHCRDKPYQPNEIAAIVDSLSLEFLSARTVTSIEPGEPGDTEIYGRVKLSTPINVVKSKHSYSSEHFESSIVGFSIRDSSKRARLTFYNDRSDS